MPEHESARADLEGQIEQLRARVRELEKAAAERTVAEQRAASEQRELQQVLDSVTAQIWYMDREGRVVRCNRVAENVAGTTSEQAAGGTIHTLAAGWDDPDRRHQQTLAVARTGQPLLGSIESFCEHGQTRWATVDKVPWRDGSGAIIGVLLFIYDITDLKRAEESLRRSESFLSSIINQSPYPMWISDDRGTLVSLNQACRELLHIFDEEVVGKYNILEDEVVEQQGFLPLVRRVFEAGETVRFEIKYDSGRLRRLHLASSVVVILDVTMFPIKDPQGRTVNAVIQHVDITQRKRAEEELKSYRDHLEELVARRTQELEESREQMRQAERLASVGTLAAGIAHEINNPVGGILVAAQVALASLGDRNVVEQALNDIIRDAERCGRIVKGVLKFSRQESAGLAPRDLNVLVGQAVELSGKQAENSGCVVESQLDAGALMVNASETEIEQVVVNLIANAVEAGARRVILRTEAAAEVIRLIVEDDGSGMTPEQKSRMFDPFYTTRQGRGGTGLGLSITHGILREHEATIEVDSKVGRGTRMILTFPSLAPKG